MIDYTRVGREVTGLLLDAGVATDYETLVTVTGRDMVERGERLEWRVL